jgi:hypothetical protein
VKAVILLFPLDETIRSQRKLDEERVAREGQPLLDKTILWIKQTARVSVPIPTVLDSYMHHQLVRSAMLAVQWLFCTPSPMYAPSSPSVSCIRFTILQTDVVIKPGSALARFIEQCKGSTRSIPLRTPHLIPHARNSR